MEQLTKVSHDTALGNDHGIHAASLYGTGRKTLADHLLSGTHPANEDYKLLEYGEHRLSGLAEGCDKNNISGSFLESASILHTASGNIFGVIETIRDITHVRSLEKELQRQQEELTQSYEELALSQEELRESYQILADCQQELEENELKYRTLIENSNDGIFMIQDHRLLYINPKCSEMTGYGEGDLYRMEIWDIIIPEDRISMIHTIKKSIAEDSRRFHHTARVISKTGEIKTVDFAFGIVEYKGRPALLGRARNISEKIRIEQALERANRKLHLLSGITRHDIKNHLTSLLGALSLIAESDVSDENRTLINLGLESAKQIDVDISFTSIYQDIGSASPVWIPVVKEFISLLPFMQSHGVQFFTTISEDLEIFVDSLFSRVCFNLVENAIRHGNISKLILTLEEKEGYIFLYLTDDGIGVVEEEKSRIFSRGHGKNTGMGLFLCKEILDITGIDIHEIGKEGHGAIFQLTIPTGGFRTRPDLNNNLMYEN